MVFQAHALFPHMNVGDNVGFGLKMRGIHKTVRRNLVMSALTTVRLQSFYDRMPHELSGGQQQRVALARAIVIKPKVLLLDEPFGALDRKLRESLQVELREVTRTLGITSIFVTHDQEEALVLSDRVAVMNSGKIEQVGGPQAVFETPASRFVADFMGFANLREAVVVHSVAQEISLDSEGLKLVASSNSGHPRTVGSRIGIGIRRERIAIRRLETAPDQANCIAGIVESSIYHGNLWSYRVATRSGDLLVARPPDDGDRGAGLEVGAKVALSWDKNAVRVFDA
jgi:ABC-type Fe3+/spermidine/putrescine transport system ATPase subunit